MPPWAALPVRQAPGRRRPTPPAVPVKKSVDAPTTIVCLEDGKKLKMLKRYLRVRATRCRRTTIAPRWNLPRGLSDGRRPTMPRARSEFAKKIGLGKRQKAPVGQAEEKA